MGLNVWISFLLRPRRGGEKCWLLTSACLHSCVYIRWELHSSTHESHSKTCQAEKWTRVLGSVACRSEAWFLMRCSVSPAQASQGACSSGRFHGSQPQLHIPTKLLLLDPAKGLCRLWCRYLQHSQPLKFNPELLSTWRTTSFVWHESWRVLETVAGWDSEGITLTLHLWRVSSVLWTLCLMLHGVMPSWRSNLSSFTRCWVSD